MVVHVVVGIGGEWWVCCTYVRTYVMWYTIRNKVYCMRCMCVWVSVYTYSTGNVDCTCTI